MKRIFIYVMVVFLAGFSFACRHKSGVTAAPYTDESLYNYQMAKYYTSEGRFELAKEHLTLALAANRDPNMQRVLVRDLDSVNMMIQTLR